MVSPKVSAILSFFVPGLGQVLQNNRKFGYLLLVVWLAIWILWYFTTNLTRMLLCFTVVLLGAFAAYDTYSNSKA